jgi:outer membrane lipoprotein LolB
VRLWALFLAALLGGCASLTHQVAQTREGDLHLSGKLSVQVEGDGERKGTGGSAAFELSGGPSAGQLELSTPLGSLMARATWSEGEALLRTTKGERRFDDLDALTRELLGEPIPVAALFDWLQGRAWPQAGSAATDAGFEQLGWRIDLSRFADGVLIATRIAAPQVILRARIEKP